MRRSPSASGQLQGRKVHRKLWVGGALFAGDLVSAGVVVAAIWLLVPGAALDALARALPYGFAPFVVLACLGHYSGSGPSPYERFARRLIGVSILVFCGAVALASNRVRPGAALVDAGVLGFIFFTAGHYGECAVRAVLIRAGLWGAPTVIVGEAGEARRMAEMLAGHPELGLSPVLVESTDEATLAPTREAWSRAEVVLFTSRRDLETYASQTVVEPTQRLLLAEPGIAGQSLWMRSTSLNGARALEIRRDLNRKSLRLIKRAIDLAIALVAGLVAAPVIAVLAIAVYLIDGGPVFFAQERVGLDGKPLKMLKLRSMRRDAAQRLERLLATDPKASEEWNRYFKLSRDPRILPFIGPLIRKTSLDELPQLWHVIRGEMSLVGPRPFPDYHMSKFDPEFRALRVQVPPGLSGLWQVLSRSDGDVQIQREQDMFYIENWSPLLDLFILFQTLPAVMLSRGAR